jgi:hypothetical protein
MSHTRDQVIRAAEKWALDTGLDPVPYFFFNYSFKPELMAYVEAEIAADLE